MSMYVWAGGTLPIPALISPIAMPWTRASAPGVVPEGITTIVIRVGEADAAAGAARQAPTTTIAAMPDRTFAKFTFFKLDPAWQRRDPDARAEDKREFLAAC